MRTTLLSLLVLSCVAPQKRPDETLEESDSGDMESESSTDTGAGDDQEPSEFSCGDVLMASGQFELDGTVIGIDASQSTGLLFSTHHKIDTDRHDAGCVSDITIDIQQGGHGCRLHAEFAAIGNGHFELATLTFDADIYCPNFDDDLEGLYASFEPIPISVSNMPDRLAMETGTEAEICVEDIDYRLVSSGFVYREGTEIGHPFRLDLQIQGDHWSTGSGQAECGRHLDERAEEDGDPVEEAFTQTSCMYREGELGDPILCMAPTGSAFSSRSPTEVCRDFDDMYADQLASFIPSEPVDVCPESHLGACAIHPGEDQDQVWFFYVSGGEAVCSSSGGTWSTP